MRGSVASIIQRLRRFSSHLVFLLGLLAGLGVLGVLGMLEPVTTSLKEIRITSTFNLRLPRRARLTHEERRWAGIAWRYFENNYQKSTGLVNAIDRTPSTTLWDAGSYLMALISANRLGIIDSSVFHRRVSKALTALAHLPLVDSTAPNLVYNTVNGGMIEENNTPAPEGTGWSAVDVARLFVPFTIIVWNHPRHAEEVKDVIRRWAFDVLVRDGLLYGASVNANGSVELMQEGRLGYEEYAARAFSLVGINAFRALRVDDFLDFQEFRGVNVPVDNRGPDASVRHGHLVSEPAILTGIEFGYDPVWRELAFRIYLAQERRWNFTGLLTAVAEDVIDEPPQVVYNTVTANGRMWSCIDGRGDDVPQFKSLSTKAAFGWHMLFTTYYTDTLMTRVHALNDSTRGWYSGIYETSGRTNATITCATNAMVLEALCYRQYGAFLDLTRQHRPRPTP